MLIKNRLRKNNDQVKVAQFNGGNKMLKIRKLTPCECLKLMGFDEEDYKAMRKAGLSDSQIYHCAGDSIVVSVLMGIFGTLLGVEDYEQRINELTDRLVTKRKV